MLFAITSPSQAEDSVGKRLEACSLDTGLSLAVSTTRRASYGLGVRVLSLEAYSNCHHFGPYNV